VVEFVDLDCEEVFVWGGAAGFADSALADGGYGLSSRVCYAAEDLG
jgi:hypothetical protein